ncbi:integral membrane protein [Botrytis cinerea]
MEGKNALLGTPVVFTILAVIAVAIRFWVRITHNARLGWDDWLMLIAMVDQIVARVLTTISIAYQFRNPPSFQDQVNALKYNYIAGPPQLTVSVIARLSVTILLIRLFGVHLWLKRYLIVLMTILSLLTAGVIIISFAQITPVQAIWNPMIPVTKQWNPDLWLYFAVFNQTTSTLSDITFVLFPAFIIWHLNMPRRQKFGLIFLLALSLFVMIMSILKTVWVVDSYHGSKTLEHYNQTAILTLGLLEGDMVIIMGCIPTFGRSVINAKFSLLGPTILSYFGKFRSTRDASTDKDKSDRSYRTSSNPYENLELSSRRLPLNSDHSLGNTKSAETRTKDISQDRLVREYEA